MVKSTFLQGGDSLAPHVYCSMCSPFWRLIGHPIGPGVYMSNYYFTSSLLYILFFNDKANLYRIYCAPPHVYCSMCLHFWRLIEHPMGPWVYMVNYYFTSSLLYILFFNVKANLQYLLQNILL